MFKRFFFSLTLIFCANIFANDTPYPIPHTLYPSIYPNLYISGDFSSIEYHLGVLSEIERLQIPIDTVVGADWGSFVGALWSAGWSSGQIRELVKSWDSLPKAKEHQKPAIWKKTWLIKQEEDGKPLPLEIDEKNPYFGQVFFNLRMQEALWRSEPGSRLPFREIDEANDYPFPGQPRGAAPTTGILSTVVALRDTNGTAAERYQQKLWNQDSSLIILRPHVKPKPDSLFEAGVQAVQSKRSALAKINSQLSTPNSIFYSKSELPPPRFLYHPVFDSVSSEFQGHLESFWNPGDTGILAAHNFLENLQKDAYYQNLKLALDTGSFLQINAESNPQLLLSLSGYGGTLFGANIAADAEFRFVNQFGYNLNLAAFYGSGAKGVEPNLRFERFFMRDGDFFVKAKFFEYEPTSFFQKGIYEEARLLNEKSRNIILGIEKPFGADKPVLRIAVEIERREIVSGTSKHPEYDPENEIFDYDENLLPNYFSYKAIATNSLFPYAKWLWQSENYDRWFASDGFMAELTGGFRALSVSNSGQNVPLYVSSQGKIGITHPLSSYVSVSGGAEFGANFRRTDKGKMVLPDELLGFHFYDDGYFYDYDYDPALDNRYRFAMGMGFYQEMWQTPDNSSHRYGLLSAGFSLHWRGSGIFFTGGFAKDGEPNLWSELSARRLFAEPKLRIKTKIFDLVLGQSFIYSIKSSEKRSENRFFLNIAN